MGNRSGAAWLVKSIAISFVCAGVVAAQPGTERFSVTIDGLPPGTAFELAINGGKIGTQTVAGTASVDGVLALALNVGKVGPLPDQVEVWVGEDCPDKAVRVWIVEQGGKPPDECKRRLIGAFWWHKTRHVQIHWPNGLVADSSGLSTKTKAILVITAAGAGSGIAMARKDAPAGSSAAPPSPSSPTTPAPPPGPTTPSISTAGGTYRLTFTVAADPNGHRTFVGFESVTMLVITISGGTISISGPAPWVTVNGTIDLTSGAFTASGSGALAGRNGVPVAVTGTISFQGMTATGSFTVAVGGGGSLPGNVDDGRIRYSGNGTRQ